jgi:hypothetical protein
MGAVPQTDNKLATKGGPLPGLLRPPIIFLAAILSGIALNQAWRLYILDLREPGDDEKSLKIFAILYEHELLHVLDETDIVKNWLPRMAIVDVDVIKYFVRTEPFTYGLQSQSIADARKEFLDKYIGQSILNLWATEANRRTGIRDAPGEYKKVNDQIEKIRYGRLP